MRKGHVDNRPVLDFRKRRPGSRRPARSAPRREREAAICSGRTGDCSELRHFVLRVYYKLKLKYMYIYCPSEYCIVCKVDFSADVHGKF